MKFGKRMLIAIAIGSLSFAVSCSQPKDDSGDDVSGSVNLASLSVSPGELVPKFDKDTTQYTVTVPNSVTSITVEYKPEDKYAGAGMVSDTPLTNLGVGETLVNLDVGETEVVVGVNSADFTEIKRYNIVITRQAQ